MRSAFYAAIIMILCSGTVQAKDPTDKYVDANFVELTRFSAQLGGFDLKDEKVFQDYLKSVECDIYQSAKDSQFMLREIQQAVLKSQETAKEKVLYFKIPATFKISNYNFDTQSFSILPGSQLQRVNLFQLLADEFIVCANQSNAYVREVPTKYFAKLALPISFYRIPLKRNAAEALFKKLDKTNDTDQDVRYIYGTLYIQLDPTQPELVKTNNLNSATLFGQLNIIDLFVDYDRKILLKRLNYEDSF